ncbi:MAG: radical SAM protein, partial [candidate division Zixibacteria bacterium]|nr:radical SAM protein [candidate division Zixibacteria bacterium]
MKVIRKTADSDIATVYIAEADDGRLVEFVESVQPPLTRSEKWIMLVSTLFGCPVGCKFCDAGGDYRGKLSVEQIFYQIDYLINKRFPDGVIDTNYLKIQFARMGEP